MSFLRRKTTPLVSIREIHPSLDTCKIKVNIMKLWRKYIKGTVSIEMVLIDDEGNRIHATVEGDDLVKSFENKLAEGESKIINTFKISSYNGDFRTSSHPFKISFYRTTYVDICEDFPTEVPEKYYRDFTDILSRNIDKNILIDIIGQIVSVGSLCELTAKGNPTKKIDIILRDTSGMHLPCTLWGDYATQIFEYSNKHKNSKVVCVFRFVCIKEYKGVVSVSNAFNSTQIMFDLQTPYVKRFISMLPTENLSDNNMPSTLSSVSLHDEFLGKKNVRKHIWEIIQSNEVGRCVTMATIDSVSKDCKWYYIVCKACDKTVQPYPYEDDKPPLFDCENCGDITDVDARYRLILHVSEGFDEQVKFLLFDILAQYLLQKTAFELAEEVAEEEPHVLPEALKNLIGKKLLFKINIGEDNLKSKNASYKVEKFTDKKDIIENFWTQSSDEETISHSSSTNNVCNSLQSSPSSQPLSYKRRYDYTSTSSQRHEKTSNKTMRIEKPALK
ncbi:unnamed protein product [Brassica rapa]|uniref:DUF223 domain-containing protein n=1 Tax=Brassica campestris TaxID=3711 RepID=A0A8D9HNM1_BRACM|nr:unnamed protein product [Brassica rapa]